MTAGVLGYAQRACKQAGGSDAKHHFENILTVLTNKMYKHFENMRQLLQSRANWQTQGDARFCVDIYRSVENYRYFYRYIANNRYLSIYRCF